jgi:F5/8 type C domain/Bacterial Ig domain
MFDNKESIGFLTHRRRSILTVIGVFGILAQLALFGAYENVVATSNSDDDRELDIQCETGNEDVCLIAACMGHPCVWYQNSSGGIERNFDVAITEYNTPSLDSSDVDLTSNVMQIDDACMEPTSNIQLISTSRIDDARSVNNDDDDDDEKDDENSNDSVFAKLLDNDYDTKWEEEGFGSFIQADLGSVESVCNVGIAWDKGDDRSYNFVISTSDDGTTFTDALRGTSSGSTEALETYDLTDVDSRFIRVTVFGNNDDNNNEEHDTAAINEIRVGTSTSTGSPSNNNSSNGQSELSEVSPNANNTASSSTNSTEITPDDYISELTDLMVIDGYEDRVQERIADTTNLPPSVEDLNIRAASVSSLEIELKGSDIGSPDKLGYSVVDLPTHGVLKAGTDEGRVLYYPNAGYVGSDSFTYRAIDDQGLESVLGTVDIAIEDS